MAFSTQGGGGALRSEINITPMIDVLLVLIVVFMIVVAMSQEKGLKAEIPQPADPKTQSPKVDTNIVIQIAWAGEKQPPGLKINQENVKWEDLHDRLFDIYKQRADHVAFVKGDDEINFQYVADAISIARNSGVDKIGLLTRTGPESP
jgi:biopolymer transport protein TolR